MRNYSQNANKKSKQSSFSKFIINNKTNKSIGILNLDKTLKYYIINAHSLVNNKEN